MKGSYAGSSVISHQSSVSQSGSFFLFGGGGKGGGVRGGGRKARFQFQMEEGVIREGGWGGEAGRGDVSGRGGGPAFFYFGAAVPTKVASTSDHFRRGMG